MYSDPDMPMRKLTALERAAQIKYRNALIEKAFDMTPPDSGGKSPSHEEMMRYLRYVLVPALSAIARRLEDTELPEPSDDERQKFAYLWERVAKIIADRHPRPTDISLPQVNALLARTRSISPSEVRALRRRNKPK